MSNEESQENLNEINDEHKINRPPKSPGPNLGPYYQFLTTDLEKMQWIGSVLILRHISLDRPKIEFFSDAKIDFEWEILYENLFDMCIYRINLTIEIRKGNNDEKIVWIIDWGDYITNGIFFIAQLNQTWRGGFFSCNGFDATIPKEKAESLNYDNVWNHLNSIHQKTPLHILLWGGDQSYNDFVIEDIPYLHNWSQLPFDNKWTYEFDDNAKIEVEKYYFYTYAEHWDHRPEIKRALGSIPSLMMWNDHDIFDGAGSYPSLLQQSPIMSGLFIIAQKMRLLFQHHTTLEKAREHHLFGDQSYNYLARCGPNLMILGNDERTERTTEVIQNEKTWNIIFDKLNKDLNNIEHLIVLFPVPFSFLRIKIAESNFERVKKFALKWKDSSIMKHTNSVFGLPEQYDDLLDEWTHRSHITERNQVLERFQKLSQEKKVRITFFSGDVHCCGISRFQTSQQSLLPLNDNKLMYQIISSAIVNMPPSRLAIRCAHVFATKWHPIENTEEEVIDFFDKMPEDGSKLYLRKLLPNRNWCYFEQCVEMNSVDNSSNQTGYLEAIQGNLSYILSNLNFKRLYPSKTEKESTEPIEQDIDEVIPAENIINDNVEQKRHNLKIRFWLESTEYEKNSYQQFASYDLCIPNLE